MAVIITTRALDNTVSTKAISMWNTTFFSFINENRIADLEEVSYQEHELEEGGSISQTVYECDFAGFQQAVNDNQDDDAAIAEMRELVEHGAATGASRLVITAHS